MNFIPYIKEQNTPKLTDVKGEPGENGSIVWEIKKQVDDRLTMEEMRRLKGPNPNYQRAADVKRLKNEGVKCREIAVILKSKYSIRSTKGTHAELYGEPKTNKKKKK